MTWFEVFGIGATIFLIISMACKTSSYKGTVIMRITNIVACILFVIYGALVTAWSTLIANAILVCINTFHLIVTIKQRDKLYVKKKEE